MILKLSNKEVQIQPMKIPVPKKNVYIEYAFEAGTNHLLPRLTINGVVHEGNRIYVDLSYVDWKKDVTVYVSLVDGKERVLHKYTCKVPHHEYLLFGKKPLREDVEAYVYELEERIRELEEAGEVV